MSIATKSFEPFIVAENAVVLWWIKLGLGRHASALPPQNVAEAPRIIFIAGLLYELTITLPKLSALLFYNRMFGKTSLRYFHAGLWTLGFLNAGWFISTVLSTLFACKPVHKSWDPLVPGECVPQWEFFLGKALSSMIIDLGILALPMPIIWNLQVPTRKKLLIMAVFFFGYCVLFVSIGRLVSISKAGSWLETDITCKSQPQALVSVTNVADEAHSRESYRVHHLGPARRSSVCHLSFVADKLSTYKNDALARLLIYLHWQRQPEEVYQE